MWYDLFRLWKVVTTKDPRSRRGQMREIEGAGVTQPDVMPDIRADGSFWGGGRGAVIRLRDSTDFVDLSSVTNRQSRYKEYERLRNTAEIETAMTVYADESCVHGNTKVCTPFGYIPIAKLAEIKKPDEMFMVYCYDFAKEDFTLGWAYHPRKTTTRNTVKICFGRKKSLICTPDHKILKADGTWAKAVDLDPGDEVMPFYREGRNSLWVSRRYTKKQFARILTRNCGWKSERRMLNELKNGKPDNKKRIDAVMYCVAQGMNSKQIARYLNRDWSSIDESLSYSGIAYKEIKNLCKKRPNKVTVTSVKWNGMEDVYDLTVKDHHNFCTNSAVVHNCQKGDNGHVCEIRCKNADIRNELEFLFFHPKMLNIDRSMFSLTKNLYTFGDYFLELIIDPEEPKNGILRVQPLPADSMYRIETIKGKLLEFQQSKTGPDYESLARVEVTQATDLDLMQATAIRFAPESIVHFRIGEERKTFYPYGVSLIEPARGPAHNLKLMEDSMMVYRLVRGPERRVFYIDVGNLPPFKAEMTLERLKDQLRKRKTFSAKAGGGASSVEERWQAPSQEEDIWIPVRPDSNTRVETLPGACLSLDTEIPLLDGRTLALKDIIGEYEAGKQLWAYSCNPQTGEPVPGKITWAGVTRKNTQVVKLTFDNGESVVCTPDHKFPIIGKGNIEAKDLQVGESLIPFNTRMENLSQSKKSKYLQIYDNDSKKWEFVHRLVMKNIKETQYYQEMVWLEKYKNEKKGVIHHKNYNRLDNTPENLAMMHGYDHVLYHRHHQEITNINIGKALKKYHENLSEEEKKKRNEIMKAKAHKGRIVLNEKMKNKEFRDEFLKKMSEGWEKFKTERPDLYKERSDKISKRNKELFNNNDGYKNKVFIKQTIVYPQELFDAFMDLMSTGLTPAEALPIINSNKELINFYIDANKHIARNGVFDKGLTRNQAIKMAKVYGYSTLFSARKFAVENSDNVVTRNLKGHQKGMFSVKYPKVIMDAFMKALSEGHSVKESVSIINTKEFIDLLVRENEGLARKNTVGDGFTVGRALKMVKRYGYEGLEHARNQSKFYNHKIIKIEYLNEKIDTGTLTIDGDEELHNFHNFALKCGVFTKNSHLGEVSDVDMMRNKLFIALNFPKSYMTDDDPQAARMTLSSLSAKFAKQIERLQQSLADGLTEIAIRHLELRGYPEDLYDDLQIKMTTPGYHRELSLNEILEMRYNRAMAVKGSQMMADIDIYTKILMIPEDQAREMVARAEAQKVNDLKLQILAQNPQLMGVASQQPEMGVTGEPNAQLPAGQEQPPQQAAMGQEQMDTEAPPEGQGKVADTYGQPPKAEVKPFPEPTKEEIDKYDLGIMDYSKGLDDEEVDTIELDDEE